MMSSLIRQNYHDDTEALINKQINMELYASYVYQVMAFHFNQDDSYGPGFSSFFHKSSGEERMHAELLMKYQNKRGGRIVLQKITAPVKTRWESGREALEDALVLEKKVNDSLLSLHKVASGHNDPHACDFLETNFLNEQVDAIKQLADMVTQLTRAGPGLGEHLFDKELKGQ